MSEEKSRPALPLKSETGCVCKWPCPSIKAACVHNCPPCIRWYVARDSIDVNVEPEQSRGKNFKGRRLITYAMEHNATDAFETLIKLGAEINFLHNHSRSIPGERGYVYLIAPQLLHIAAQLDHVGLVDRLLELGANIEATDGAGWTVYDYAVAFRRRAVVYLLQRKYGYTWNAVWRTTYSYPRALDHSDLKEIATCRDYKFYQRWNQILWKRGVRMLPDEWSPEYHHRYQPSFRSQVKTMMLMWNHDQYDDNELSGFEWNMLPLEIIYRIIGRLADYEDDWQCK